MSALKIKDFLSPDGEARNRTKSRQVPTPICRCMIWDFLLTESCLNLYDKTVKGLTFSIFQQAKYQLLVTDQLAVRGFEERR